MSLESHVMRRGAVYQLRVRLPQDLAGITRCREIRFSLKTRNPTEARRRGGLGRLAMIRLFGELRRMLTNPDEPTVRYLSTKEIRDLARQYFLQEINREEIYRVNVEEFGGTLEERVALRSAEEKTFREALATGRLSVIESDTDRLLAYHGIDPDFAGNRYAIPPNMLNQLRYLLLRAKLAANRIAQAHDAGNFDAVPGDPLFADIRTTDFNLSDFAMVAELVGARSGRASAPALTERQSTPLSQLCKLVMHEKELTKKTADDYENAMTWLVQIVGDMPVGRITPDDLLKFKDTLLKTPPNFGKRFKTDNILEAVKLNQNLPHPLPRMAPATINNKYLSVLREIFAWAKANHMTSGGNPAAELRLKVNRKKGAQKVRLPFTAKQLQKMFETPLYCGCKSEDRLFEPGTCQVRNHRFWVPMLALFSGCRLNEIGQMEVSDIKPHNGRLHLFVRTERDPEDEFDDDIDERSLKSDAAIRKVPLHPELVRLGFLNYVAECMQDTKAKSNRLFPRWQKGSDGYYSSVFSKWFNAQFLKKSGLKSPKHVFHSLRHNFKDALRNALIAPETQHRLMGHRSGHVGEQYGSGEIVESESNQIDRIRYSGLDLSHLYVSNPRTALPESGA